ncbi:DUF2721 domain-containing protein [Alsobacter sp. SYSU M60028]|uniref:DUF2721 domain-containing protein n=1 Tax=Alsobacter ponti TaxID=2962936 RepID=A0ABT1L925_9HYPH|nr:DUF2721 domain-containing protein [Alsobacter ponti]MCP8937929.1 DUF2721 domain-containing protein [Alsobacter ponti]
MSSLLTESLDSERLNAVISHATAPSFMLGAVAAFLSILVTRSERVGDQWRARLNAAGSEEEDKKYIALLHDRMRMLHRAIYLAVLSALVTALLLIVAFGSAFVGARHQVGVAVLFSTALALLMGSLVHFAREVKVAMLMLPDSTGHLPDRRWKRGER